MSNIIAITNQKGGVGKTTTAVNLAASMGHLGKKVLLVDMDPQGNTTSGVGVDKREVECSIYDVLIGKVDAQKAAKKTEFKNLDIIPSNMALAGAEVELVSVEKREFALKNALENIADQYDYVFIDCPPSLGLVTTNALCASGGIIVPLQCEFFALEGLTQLMSTVKKIKKLYNPRLDLEGIVFTMYDRRLKLTVQVRFEIEKFFKDKMYKTRIPRTVRLSEAPSFGKPVLYFDKLSKGAKAYLDLAKEIVKKEKKDVIECRQKREVLEKV